MMVRVSRVAMGAVVVWLLLGSPGEAYALPITISPGNIFTAGDTAGMFLIGDTVQVAWDNSASSGDNNSDVLSVSVNFFGITVSSADDASSCGGVSGDEIWVSCYTIVAGDGPLSDVAVEISATSSTGIFGPVADDSTFDVVPEIFDVPEPSTILLLALGLVSCAIVNRSGIGCRLTRHSTRPGASVAHSLRSSARWPAG
jgi:hypothetical protein